MINGEGGDQREKILSTTDTVSAESYLIVQKLHGVHLELMLFGPHPL